MLDGVGRCWMGLDGVGWWDRVGRGGTGWDGVGWGVGWDGVWVVWDTVRRVGVEMGWRWGGDGVWVGWGAMGHTAPSGNRGAGGGGQDHP